MQFIPDNISPAFIRIFRTYTWYLFKRRFNSVLLHNNYKPQDNKSTLYYFNHTSWWDGLIPFLLNEYEFHQTGHAIMELEQVQKIKFFRKIGAYSIDRSNIKSSLISLNYTIDVLSKTGNSVFIYPQGTIVSPTEPITLEGGLAWLYSQLPDHVDLVPGALFMHTFNSDKPTLKINIGKPVTVSKKDSRKEITGQLTHILQELYSKTSHHDDPTEYRTFVK